MLRHHHLTRAGEGDIVARLRAATRDEHDAIEATVDWPRRVSDPDRYRRWLERLHGFHRQWEPAVADALADAEFFDPRRKLHLLAEDLQRMGGTTDDADDSSLPPGTLAFGTAAEALGSMYVIEGSTLGGKIIARQVRAQLGFEPLYHASYGDDVGRKWRAFGERLHGAVHPGDHDAVIASARRCFKGLRLHLAEA